MKKTERLSQQGSMTLTVLLIAIIFVIGALIYVLGMQPGKRSPGDVIVIDTYVEQTESDISNQPKAAGDYVFDDGLKNPSSATEYSLDEFGEGLFRTEVFDIDINLDGRKDRIIRHLYENGTDHFYYDYKIEINSNNTYTDITPKYFRTTEGAECALQKLRFIFRPNFSVIKISRPWEESWISPSLATKTTYRLINNVMTEIAIQPMKKICNVSDLF